MKTIFKWLTEIFIILLLIIVYARYVGTMGLVTKEYTLKEDALASSFDGIKIVHFSDLHYNRAIDINKVKSLIEEINLIKPDIVVFTGDLIDKDVTLTSKDFDDLTNLLKDIKTKYGKYSILGEDDYEHYQDEVIDVYRDSNFKYLDNSYDIIYSTKQEKIFIGGINNTTHHKDDIDKTMEYFNNNEENIYKIILVHEPDISDNIVSDYSVNLILAGHSHNGQVRLPIIGPLNKKEGAKKYYDNYYKIAETKLYISSGVGVSDVNFRLWNRPSINFYRINKEANK